MIGGTTDDRQLLTSTELFDPRTERFTAGPTLVDGRYKLNEAAAVLPDGRVVVAGSGQGVEVIDVERRTSTVAAGLADVSGSFSTVSVVGDEVWVLGGYDRQIRMTSTDRRVADRRPLALEPVNPCTPLETLFQLVDGPRMLGIQGSRARFKVGATAV